MFGVLAGQNKEFKGMNVERKDGAVTLTSIYYLRDVASDYTVKYTVYADGRVKLTVAGKAGNIAYLRYLVLVCR